MINIRKKFCIEHNCYTEPTYNYINIKNPKYCAKHKKDDMINVKDINKYCKYTDCTTIAVYNYSNIKNGIYCTKHKLNGMIDVISKKCIYNDCITLATFNFENNITPVYCYYHIYPNSPIIRNFKTKERYISDYILQNFKDISIITDKPIYDGCSKRRPDIFIDLGYQVIIIEIDEYQHISYNSTCENKRLMEISKDINHRPLIFIRFNPDEYIDTNGNTIKSCWKLNKNGIYIINKYKEKEWEQRLEQLKIQIQYWLNNTTNKTVETIQLFYNQN